MAELLDSNLSRFSRIEQNQRLLVLYEGKGPMVCKAVLKWRWRSELDLLPGKP